MKLLRFPRGRHTSCQYQATAISRYKYIHCGPAVCNVTKRSCSCACAVSATSTTSMLHSSFPLSDIPPACAIDVASVLHCSIEPARAQRVQQAARADAHPYAQPHPTAAPGQRRRRRQHSGQVQVLSLSKNVLLFVQPVLTPIVAVVALQTLGQPTPLLHVEHPHVCPINGPADDI